MKKNYLQTNLLAFAVVMFSSCTINPDEPISEDSTEWCRVDGLECLMKKNAEDSYASLIIYQGENVKSYRICLSPPGSNTGSDPIDVHYWIEQNFAEDKSLKATISNKEQDPKCQDFSGYKIEARYHKGIFGDDKTRRCIIYVSAETLAKSALICQVERQCLKKNSIDESYASHVVYNGANIQTYKICLKPPTSDTGNDPIDVHYWIEQNFAEDKSLKATISNTGQDPKCQDFYGYKIESRYHKGIFGDDKTKRCITFRNVDDIDTL